MSDNPAGWQVDPTGTHDHRYWDGTQWTDNVADAGVASKDPYAPVVAEPTPSLSTPSDAPSPEDASAEAPTVVTPVSSDETTEYPAAATPTPYVPPTPVATGGDGTGGRKRNRLVIGGAILAAVAVAVIAFLALGGEDDEPAAPLADEATSTTEPAGRGEETLEDLREACADGDFEACDLLYISAERGSDLEVFGSTCGGIAAPQDGSCEATNGGEIIPGGFSPEDLMQAYGIDEEQAECVAERIGDAIRDGDLDVEQGLSNIFEVAAECDISLEELGE